MKVSNNGNASNITKSTTLHAYSSLPTLITRRWCNYVTNIFKFEDSLYL